MNQYIILLLGLLLGMSHKAAAQDQGQCLQGSLGIPTAFTPNNDGENDAFRMLGDVRTRHLYVYNRQGQEVFYGSGAEAQWDGTYKGKELPGGVYWFRIEGYCEDGQETPILRMGDITLIR